MKVKVLVTQSCLTLVTPWTVAHQAPLSGILQARIRDWVDMPFSRGLFPTQGSNPGLLHYRQVLSHLSHQRKFGKANDKSLLWSQQLAAPRTWRPLPVSSGQAVQVMAGHACWSPTAWLQPSALSEGPASCRAQFPNGNRIHTYLTEQGGGLPICVQLRSSTPESLAMNWLAG